MALETALVAAGTAVNAVKSFITTWWKVGLALILGLSLGAVVGYMKGHSAGKASAELAHSQASVRDQTQASESRDRADLERRDDDTRIATEKENRDDAIRKAGDGTRLPSSASNALNCERLRRAGRDTSHLPACS